ncbi:MAG: sulfotransferase [Planctomycetota bacterium]
MPESARAEGEGLLFIYGTGRCGTTLLQRMLDAHPRIRVVPPETRFFLDLAPRAKGLSDPVAPGDLQSYDEIIAANRFLADAGLADEYRAFVHESPRSTRELYEWLVRETTSESEADWLGEKTPQHWRKVDAIAECYPKARFIHIYRDPRDVVASLLRQTFWTEHTTSVYRTAKLWPSVMATAERLTETLGPRRAIEIRYETLADEPGATLETLCAFLDAEFDEAMLRYNQTTNHGFPEAEMAGKAGALQPLQNTRHGRYAKFLRPDQIRLVEMIAGERLRQRGYETDPNAAKARHSMSLPLAWVADASRKLKRSVRKRLGVAAAHPKTPPGTPR